MQQHVKVCSRLVESRLMEDALIHDPCPAQHQQERTCQQPPLTDERAHPLVETNGEDDRQQAGDNQVRVQNPAARSHSQVADRLMNWRVAWAQQASQGKDQDTKDGADNS